MSAVSEILDFESQVELGRDAAQAAGGRIADRQRAYDAPRCTYGLANAGQLA